MTRLTQLEKDLMLAVKFVVQKVVSSVVILLVTMGVSTERNIKLALLQKNATGVGSKGTGMKYARDISSQNAAIGF
ncbi:hypothetical protein ACFX2H_007923 [Malus domestica]